MYGKKDGFKRFCNEEFQVKGKETHSPGFELLAIMEGYAPLLMHWQQHYEVNRNSDNVPFSAFYLYLTLFCLLLVKLISLSTQDMPFKLP